jgi:hypothetical protein
MDPLINNFYRNIFEGCSDIFMDDNNDIENAPITAPITVTTKWNLTILQAIDYPLPSDVWDQISEFIEKMKRDKFKIVLTQLKRALEFTYNVFENNFDRKIIQAVKSSIMDMPLDKNTASNKLNRPTQLGLTLSYINFE